MRIILYTGKGGVGKTSVSAATAVRAAELGQRTIVLSTDAAHSLADSFEARIGDEPRRIADRLWAQEINVNNELKKHWGTIQEFVVRFLKAQGFEDVMAEEFSIFPGMEELFSLLTLKEYHERKAYDVAIIDCAPTGSTIRMLSFPDILQWYMEKFFHIERRLMKAVRPVAERIVKVPMPTDDVYGSIEKLYLKVEGMKALLTDVGTSTIRLVTNPEKMVIKESQRVYTYLSLFGFSVDGVIINRVIPPEIEDRYFGQWKEIQKRYIREAYESFQPLPIFEGKLFDREVIGIPLLGEMARDIFKDRDPAEVFFREKPMEIVQRGREHVVYLKLPFTDKKGLELWARGEELILTLGNFRRTLFLPRTLADLPIREAEFEGGKLAIVFGPAPACARTPERTGSS